jgi:hypothetical protein
MSDQPLIREDRTMSPWQDRAKRRAAEKNAAKETPNSPTSDSQSRRAANEARRQTEYERALQQQAAEDAKARDAAEARRRRKLAEKDGGRNVSGDEARERQKYENGRDQATASYDKNRNPARTNYKTNSAQMSLENEGRRKHGQGQSDAMITAANNGEDPWRVMDRQHQGGNFGNRLQRALREEQEQRRDPNADLRAIARDTQLRPIELKPFGITSADPNKQDAPSIQLQQMAEQQATRQQQDSGTIDLSNPNLSGTTRQQLRLAERLRILMKDEEQGAHRTSAANAAELIRDAKKNQLGLKGTEENLRRSELDINTTEEIKNIGNAQQRFDPKIESDEEKLDAYERLDKSGAGRDNQNRMRALERVQSRLPAGSVDLLKAGASPEQAKATLGLGDEDTQCFAACRNMRDGIAENWKRTEAKTMETAGINSSDSFSPSFEPNFKYTGNR